MGFRGNPHIYTLHSISSKSIALSISQVKRILNKKIIFDWDNLLNG